MKVKSKILIPAISIASVIVIAVTLFYVFSKKKTVPSSTYAYEKSLKQAETIENIVLDGVKNDEKWQSIKPYSAKTSKDNREAKYAVFEPQIKECNVNVYTYLGENGLFIYADTDEPIINTSTYSPFNTSAFDFYIQSQDALSRIGNLYNLCVGANGNMILRVRTVSNSTGEEVWENRPAIGSKFYVSINKIGYSAEIFVPYSTLNMSKPKYLQLATAMSRCINSQYQADRYWELLEYSTGPIAFTNSSTYPIFDETGYIGFTEGENFLPTHSNIIDFSSDNGLSPFVTTLNRSTVTSILNTTESDNVYWESNVKINDFNYTDDPRVGILLRTEKDENGAYDQIYLLAELEKDYKGENYSVKDVIVLPYNNKKNEWTAAQRFNITSALKDKKIKFAVLKQGSKLSFYINDILISERSNITGFDTNTKVLCGITSWYVGAEFSDYHTETKKLDSIAATKTKGFLPDNRYTQVCFDMLTQNDNYLISYANKTNNTTLNFNKEISKEYTVSTNISELKSFNGANDSRQGFVLTRELNKDKYRRLFVLLRGNSDNKFHKIEVYCVDNDDFGSDWSNVKTVMSKEIDVTASVNFTVSVGEGHAVCYLDGKYIADFDLTKYEMEYADKVGLSSWKGTAKFTNPNLSDGAYFSVGENFKPTYNGVMDFSKDYGKNPQVTSNNAGTATVLTNKAATKNVYFESNVNIKGFNAENDPRVGIILQGEKKSDGSYNQVFLLLELDKDYKGNGCKYKDILILPSSNNGNDWNGCQRINVTSVEQDNNLKLAVLKQGNEITFYLNDVMVGKRSNIKGLTAETNVSCGITSWYTDTVFYGYTQTGNGLDSIAENKTAGYIIDGRNSQNCFDVLTQNDGYLMAYSTKTNHTDLNFNRSISDKYSVTAKISDLVSFNNANDSRQGFVLTKELANNQYRRIFVLLRGNSDNKFHNIEVYCVDNDDFGSDWSKVKNVNSTKLEALSSVDFTLSVGEGHAVCYLDGKYVTDFDLTKYGMDNADNVGLTSWKGTAKFTNIDLTEGSNFYVGENFKTVYDGSMDFSKDYGENPEVTSLDSKTVNIFTNNDASSSAYFESTVKINSFDSSTDPRVGIRVMGDKQADGSYSQVYLLLELDKNYKGKGYKINDIAILPSNNEGNVWSACKRYNIDSVVNDPTFKLAILKLGDTFSFYLNDVLLLKTNQLEKFDSETKVTGAVSSWFVGTTFSGYKFETENLEKIEKNMHAVFVSDSLKNKITFDYQKECDKTNPKVTVNSAVWDESIINFNAIASKTFYAETNIKINGNNNNGNYATGMVLSSGDTRLYIMLFVSGEKVTLKALPRKGTDTASFNAMNGNAVFSESLSVDKSNYKLALYRDNDELYILINDKVIKAINLKSIAFPMTEGTTVGITVEKAIAEFTDYRITVGDDCDVKLVKQGNVSLSYSLEGNYDQSTKTITVKNLGMKSSVGTANQEFVLGDANEKIYVETTLKTTAKNNSVYSRVGLRLTNETGDKNIDFAVGFNKNTSFVPFFMSVETNQSSPTTTSTDVSGTSKYYSKAISGFDLTTVKNEYKTDGVKLAVAKVGNTFYFYVNDLLVGTNTYSDFGENEKVIPKFYSKFTESTCENFNIDNSKIPTTDKSKQVQATNMVLKNEFAVFSTIISKFKLLLKTV